MILRRILRGLLVLLLAGAGLYLGSPFVLAALGRHLITGHPAAKADLAVVLSGAPFLAAPEAARLYRDGLAPVILVTAPARPAGLDELRRSGLRYPDEQETTLAVLDGLGVPRTAIQALGTPSDGLREEAEAVARFVAGQPVRTLVLVTAKSRTTRSYVVLRAALPAGVTLRAQPAATDPFDPARWWTTRRHVRVVVHEYIGLAEHWWGRLWAWLWSGWLPAAGPVRTVRAGG